jgi:hypothetical protein
MIGNQYAGREKSAQSLALCNFQPRAIHLSSPQKFPSWRISATMLATMADLANYQLEKSAANVLA